MNALLNLYPGDAIALLAIHVVVLILLVVPVTWILAQTLARRDPAIRYGLWVCALLAVLLSPLAVWTLDAAGVTIIAIPLVGAETSSVASAMATERDNAIAVPEPKAAAIGRPSGAAEVALPELKSPAPMAIAVEDGNALPRPTPPAQVAGSDSHTPPAAMEPAPCKSFSLADRLRLWGVMTAAVWAAGVVFLLARLLHGWLAIRRLRRALLPVAPESLGDTWGEVRRALGAERLPPIALTRLAGGPMTMGVWRPLVVLPEDFINKLARPALCSVLVHECAHALRRDSAIGLLQRFAAILFWPHPLVHVLSGELTRAREEVCDNFVLRQAEAADYVGTLLLIAETFLPARRPAMIGLLEHRCRLERRAAGLLDPDRKITTRLHRGLAAVLAAGFLAAVFLVAGTRLLQAQPPLRPAQGNSGTIAASPADAERPQASAAAGRLVLDFARFFSALPPDQEGALAAFSGRHLLDGLPFQVDGQARLWGQSFAERHRAIAIPETLEGIRVGRAFDELHLIHFTEWPDVEGQTIAYVSLNYADGTKSILPIRYGVQVVDWYYLPSYEKGLPTDPQTKVCWQRTPLQYKAPIRLFKSKLLNPWPGKMVDTLDVISARGLCCYNLVAAAVADRDPHRPITPPLPATEPARKFDGKVTVKVVDEATGKPIEGALVEPSIDVVEEWVVGAPFYTSSAGAGTIPYPVKQTTRIAVEVKKEGYLPKWEDWQGNVPAAFTFQLAPAGGGAREQEGSLLGTLEEWFSGPAKPKKTPAAKSAMRPLFLIDSDGSHWHSFVSIPEYTACGSPDWSRDGTKIAFDAWRASRGEHYPQGHVFVASADGSWVEDLGPGGIPSWSPGGRQIAFTHWHPESGVSIMNADGSDRQLLDADGWGAKWSPRRNEIAYVINPDGGQKFCIYQVDSKDRRTLLGSKSFRHIQGFSWSPDGAYLCFKGVLPGGAPQFAVVHREGVPKGFKVLLPSTEMPNVNASSPWVSWGGNGNQILISVRGETDRSVQIHVVDFMGRQPTKLLPGQDPQRDNIDAAWSPDGKRIVLASSVAVPAPQPAVESPRPKEAQAPTETVHGKRPRGNCSISGKVISAATGKPVDHAGVYLFYLPTYCAIFINVAGDGTFIFKDIPKGPFSLRSIRTAEYQDAAYDPEERSRQFPQFSLKDGEHRDGVVLKVKPACRISGKILDEKGEIPADAAGLTVLAWFERSDGKGYESRQARVDRKDGSYVIDGLGDKPVYVMALNWRAAKRGNACPPIYYPGTFFRSDAKRIAFDKRQRIDNVNIRLQKEGGLVLEGTVRDEAGKPVPEAFVVVHRRDMLFDFVTAYTERQGRYQIHGLGDGEFLVHVDAVHRGFVRTRTPIDLSRASKPARLNFTLARGVAISGKLVDEKGDAWQIGRSYGFAHNIDPGHRQFSSLFSFSLTDFRNKYRPKDAGEGSGGSFAPGEGAYDSGEMIFLTKSTFIIQGMKPGHTIIDFGPQKEGQKVVKILQDGRNIMKAGITTKAGQEIKDVIIVVGKQSAGAAGPAGEKATTAEKANVPPRKTSETAKPAGEKQSAADQHFEPSLVGSWRADSISMALADGKRKTLAGEDGPVSVIISATTFTIRLGGTILASMSYVLDPKHDPWTVDMKSKDGSLLGICVKRGDKLAISLDDQPKGRPRDFNPEKHAMVLVLRRFLALDPFQGHWALDWKPIRFDPSHVSLTKNPGCLTITTQIGSIHGKEKERGEPSAKNLFVLENPLAKDADFAITTCISGFTPQMAFQQAGLICYHDDDNYAKWVYMLDYSNGAGQAFSFLRETNAESTFEHQPAPSDFQRLWLRLTRRGRFYEYSASTDGKTFTTYGKQPWDGIPSRVGILAKNGGRPGVPEVDVCFHFFELRSPPAPENE